MSDPRRMLDVTADGADDELALELLRAGRAEQPTSAARQRAMVAAGVTTAVAVTTVAAATTTAAAAAEASLPPVAAKAGASGVALTVKWVGIAAVGALGLFGAWRAAAPEPVAAVASVGLAVAEVEARVDAQVDGAAEEAVVEAPPSSSDPDPSSDSADGSESVAVATPATTGTAKAAPSASSDLVAEVAAIDRARAAMEKDPEAALAELEDYRRTFGGGALAQEAEVLRIESLARSGRDAEATQAAKRFLAEHPESPLAGRVRAVLGG